MTTPPTEWDYLPHEDPARAAGSESFPATLDVGRNLHTVPAFDPLPREGNEPIGPVDRLFGWWRAWTMPRPDPTATINEVGGMVGHIPLLHDLPGAPLQTQTAQPIGLRTYSPDPAPWDTGRYAGDA